MANKYVDTQLVTGLNDGTSFDNAWQSLKTALETARAAGDTIWIRRRSSFSSPSANITTPAASDGNASTPIRWIGWPRTTQAIAASTWTHGDTTVAVAGGGMSRGAHQGRWLVAPDGVHYLVTRVVSATSIVIDRPYVGATVTGAATFEADGDLAEAQAIDDSTWSVKKTDWNADANTLPYLDFGAAAFGVNNAATAVYWRLMGLDFRNGTNANGTVMTTGHWVFIGCLFQQTQNTPCLNIAAIAGAAVRSIFEGNGAGANQRGVTGYQARLKDCAIWGMGGFGLAASSYNCALENVNIGVEVPNATFDVSVGLCAVMGFDVKLGGTNGIFSANPYTPGGDRNGQMVIENYGKVLGAHAAFHIASTMRVFSVAVVEGSGDPQKRGGGASDVMEFQQTGARLLDYTTDRWAAFRIWAPAGVTKTYRLYCQNKDHAGGILPAEFKLRGRYISAFYDAASYQHATVESDETIALRTGAGDWSQYVEVALTPAADGWVTLELLGAWNDTAARLYVDPQVAVL